MDEDSWLLFKMSIIRTIFYALLIGVSFIPFYTTMEVNYLWVMFGIASFMMIMIKIFWLSYISKTSNYDFERKDIACNILNFIIFCAYSQFISYLIDLKGSSKLNPPVIIAEILGALMTYDILTGVGVLFLGAEKSFILYIVFMILNWIGYVIFNLYMGWWGISAIFAVMFTYCLVTRLLTAHFLVHKDIMEDNVFILTAQFHANQFWGLYLVFFVVLLIISLPMYFICNCCFTRNCFLCTFLSKILEGNIKEFFLEC